MALSKATNEMSVFLESGIYKFESSNAIFMDPVRVLNRSYTCFRVSPLAYYHRFFELTNADQSNRVSSVSRKRKRDERKHHTPNEKELAADQRHQEARPLLVKAHECLLGATDLLAYLSNLRGNDCSNEGYREPLLGAEQSFIELGSVWQAPLYEISLNINHQNEGEDGGSSFVQYPEQKVLPIFNSVVENEAPNDVEAEFMNNHYILPRRSCFYMSHLRQIHNLIPVDSNCGFNLIVVDPPWENGSARQKSSLHIKKQLL